MNSYRYFIGQQWPLLSFGLLTVFAGNLGQSFFLSWFGADIQRDLSISAIDYGMTYAIATLCSSITIMFVGGMVDRWAVRRFTTLVAFVLASACLAMANVASPIMLFFAFYLLRLTGQGLLPHTAQTTMIRCYTHQRGKAISIAGSGVAIGEVILPTLVVILIGWLGWRSSWLALSAVVVFIYLPIAYYLLSKTDQVKILAKTARAKVTGVNKSGRREVLSDWRFWSILPSTLAAPFVVTGVFIQQNFLLTQKVWSPTLLANSFVAYGIMHWVSSMIAGTLVDKYGAKRLLAYFMLPLISGLAVLAYFNQSWSAMLFMTLFGLGIGASGPVINALWAEVYGTEHIGAIRSMMTSLMILSTAAAPWIFGLFIEMGWSDKSFFGMLAVVMVVVALMVLPAQRSFIHSGFNKNNG
ncbi:MFS transporter [Vibrio sp. MACH09]|uniref:MFS transporter n=1 Tax=Vibrio sp. MACH09 TaxID=3025122 RepID=UPI0027927F92|nr:MFS transporter [Vibrio sp. MACH09]GLO60280.1 MFS transporter [Vibrio sp. MACH09]